MVLGPVEGPVLHSDGQREVKRDVNEEKVTEGQEVEEFSSWVLSFM